MMCALFEGGGKEVESLLIVFIVAFVAAIIHIQKQETTDETGR